MELAKRFPNEFAFGANEVSDLADAPAVVEKYLKLGACIIGEQKFGVECDSAAMQRLYQLGEAYQVPILMHWQVASYNYGFERFHRMLEKYPRVNFIGHAQTWWANIMKGYVDNPKALYPTGPVTPGGLTDRYLKDYPNMFADLSAGSGADRLQARPRSRPRFHHPPSGQAPLRQRLQRSHRRSHGLLRRPTDRTGADLLTQQGRGAETAVRKRTEAFPLLKTLAQRG
jgi:hypothetical protein